METGLFPARLAKPSISSSWPWNRASRMMNASKRWSPLSWRTFSARARSSANADSKALGASNSVSSISLSRWSMEA